MHTHTHTCVASALLLDFFRMKNTSSTMEPVRLPGTWACVWARVRRHEWQCKQEGRGHRVRGRLSSSHPREAPMVLLLLLSFCQVSGLPWTAMPRQTDQLVDANGHVCAVFHGLLLQHHVVPQQLPHAHSKGACGALKGSRVEGLEVGAASVGKPASKQRSERTCKVVCCGGGG